MRENRITAMEGRTKKKPWIRFRHRVVQDIARILLYPWARLKFGARIEKFQQQGDRQYLILYNHQTVFDQFFVGMTFSGPVYFLATEDLFSNGWISRVIQFLVAPIPIKKQTTDVKAVLNCARVAREGGNIAIAPEGNRTYSGRMCYINPAVVKLAKMLKLPVAIVRIEDGYGVQPRWSNGTRRGSMNVRVSRVVEPEEYRELSDEAFFTLIRQELMVDEAKCTGIFRGRHLAEYLERAIYYCPDCGFSTFQSHRNLIHCTGCGKQIQYLPTKELEGVGYTFPYRFVADWYDAQCAFLNSQDTTQFRDTPVYRDRADLWKVTLYKNKQRILRKTEVCLYGDRIEISGLGTLPFEELSAVTVLGRNKLNLYHGDLVWQLKSGKRFNALKYVNFFWRYQTILGGNPHGEFLGL